MTANNNDNVECTCGSEAPAEITYRKLPVVGTVNINGRDIERVSTKWNFWDKLGEIKVRLDLDRMNYAVAPGIYAVGNPGVSSPVIVSANYKLSFDVLRRELEGVNAWLLVLDTKGVNVWCAAGKGTFGTKELVMRIMETKLGEIVSHKNIILPQLGAPGVSAGVVKLMSEYNVIYGPVRAGDLKRFIGNGMKADGDMRKVTFGLGDRMTVALLDFVMATRVGVIVSATLALAAFIFPAFGRSALVIGLSLSCAIIAGALLSAAALPWLPGRPFSVKGVAAGILVSILPITVFKLNLPQSISVAAAISAVSAYISVNFTGASTFTSLSGVKKELKYALPAIIGLLFVAGALAVI